MKIDEQKVVKYVLDCYQKCLNSSYRKELERKWENCHKAFLSRKDPTSFPFAGCSNVDLGIVSAAIQTFKSRLKFALVGNEPMFQISPVRAEDEKLCKLKEIFMTWVVTSHIANNSGIGISKIVDQICQNISEYGTCIIKYRWQKKTVYEKIFSESKTSFFDKFTVSKIIQKTIDERARVDVVSLEDFFVPIDAVSIEETDYCIHRVWLSENDLMDRKEVYKNIDKVINWLQEEKENNVRTAVEKVEEIPGDFGIKKVEVIEFYGKYKVDNEYRECLFTVAVKPQILLRAELLINLYEDDKKPFHKFVFEDTGSFYGRGVSEILKPLTDALNDLYNLSVNMGYYTMMPPGYIDKNADIPAKIDLKPGVLNLIDGDPHRLISFMEYPSNVQIGQSFIVIIQNYIERLLAISAPIQGVEFATKRTATEVRAVIDEGSVRHQDRIHSLQIEFAKFLKSIYRLYKDNVADDVVRNVLSNIGREIFESDDPVFVILGTLTSGNKFIEREDNLMLYQVLSPVLQSPLFQDYPELNVDLLINILQTFDKKGLLKTFENIKQEIIQRKNEAKAIEKLEMLRMPIEEMPLPEYGQTATIY